MSIDSTLINREIENVLNNTVSHSGNLLEIKIKAGNLWTTPYSLDYTFLGRGYGTGELGDIRTVDIKMAHGDFVFDILPHKDDLLVEITTLPLLANGSSLDTNAKIVVRRYKGVINASGMQDPNLTNKSATATSRESLNQISALPLTIQLIDEPVYRLMMVSTGTTFRQISPMDALMNLYSHFISSLGGDDQTRIKRIDLRKGYNRTIRNHVNIPDGTNFKDLHEWIQNNEGGLYPTGIGRYIQNQILYVFPLFNTEDYRNNTKILNVINVPNERYQGSELTYLDSETQLTVLVTGNATTMDKSLTDKIQLGNAVRFTNADKILTDNTLAIDNKVLMDKASNLTEVTLEGLSNGINNTRWATERVTSNPYRQYTELARRQGVSLTLEWTKGDAELLVPGMPVKYRTISDDLVKVYYGVLLGVSENRIPSNSGIINTRFEGIVTLSIFINRTETLKND